jgi:signal transduction histidine kinase
MSQPAIVADAPWALLVHDLRTPLTAISTQTQLLQRRVTSSSSADPQSITAGLVRIEDATHRMARLLDELVEALGPLPGRTFAARLRPTDLVQLTYRICAEAQRIDGTTGRVIVRSKPAALIGAFDSVALERVLANLVDNALKYSPDDRPVLVTIELQNETAVLRVSDHGVGIPDNELPHIFDHSYRATNVAHSIAGTGLGLTGARAIAQQHGGSLEIGSELGAGTTATLRLPVRTSRSSGASW